MKLYRQKKSKYWYFDHVFPDGTRIRQSTKKTDKYVARLAAQDIIKEKEKTGILVRKGSFFAEYLEYAKPRNVRKTITNITQIWKRFTSYVGTDEPWNITVQEADRFFTSMLNDKSNYSPATINNYQRALRMLYNKAVRWKYTHVNPFTEIAPLRFEPKVPRFLTQDELNKFIYQTKRLYPHLLPLFIFYFLTGLRRSEAFRLQWADIDFDRKLITVKNTKGKRPRFVPITPMAEKILLDRKTDDKPFASELDSEISAGFRPLERISKRAEIEHVTLHDLRRTFATYLAEHLQEKLLEQVLGHSNYSVTDIFYIGVNAENLRQKMMALDENMKIALTYRGMPQLKIMT